jgi:hypothetical protein
MDTMKIKTLLEKYFDGMTSLEEEEFLLGYFAGEGLADELVPYRDYFRLLQTGREPLASDGGFDEKLMELLVEPKSLSVPKPAVRLLPRIAAAAVIALLIGTSALFLVKNYRDNNRDTFTDPQLAYQEARRTLLYVSQNLNKGIEPLQNVNKINTGTRHLKSLNKLDHSLEMLNMVSFMNNSSNLKK